MNGIGAIVMAAGAGRRMGGAPKALLQRDGESLLARQIRLLAQAGAACVVVVLGHHAARLQAVLQALQPSAPLPLNWAMNPDPDQGPGSSLRCGLAALPSELDGIVVALGDQPLLESGDIKALLAAWATRPSGAALLVPRHAGQPGHPIVFGPLLRAAVMQASGGQGVREWRAAHPEQVQVLDAAHARYTTDVDTPQDLQRLQQQYGVVLTWPESGT